MKTQAPHQNKHSAGKKFLAASIAVVSQGWAANLIAPTRRTEDGLPANDALRATSWRSLWSLQLFLTISIAAFLVRDFNLYAAFPESVLQILGCPPPPTLAHIALAGYVFTVLTPLVIQLLSGEQPVAQWRHLGYRSAFYCFYLFSNTLAANFFLVFATGIFLYLLEQASICVAITKAGHGNGQLAG
ncbi:MAG: hypothetical protein FIB02_12890 [Desulfuromonas sp.]|nr:hypothetical protein [Desulfuromonas sp.]